MSSFTAEFDVPVLFIIFNRPQYTGRVFETIRRLKPRYLYIAADGPRHEVISDVSNSREARKITEQIDWECNVQRLYRDKNLGCRNAVYSALQWFFADVDEGIILEDDTVPSELFFQFCKNLLLRHRENEKVMMITGTSYFFNRLSAPEDYYFSSLASVWGWAGWKRSWSRMELKPGEVDSDLIHKTFKHPFFAEILYQTVSAAVSGKLDTWDAQWAYSIIKNSGLVARPFKNLVQNIGVSGTHFQGSEKDLDWFEMPYGEFDVHSIRHPDEAVCNTDYDQITFDNAIKSGRLDKNAETRIVQKFKEIISNLTCLRRK